MTFTMEGCSGGGYAEYDERTGDMGTEDVDGAFDNDGEGEVEEGCGNTAAWRATAIEERSMDLCSSSGRMESMAMGGGDTEGDGEADGVEAVEE